MSGISTYDRPNLRAAILAGDMPSWLARHKRKDYIARYALSIPSWADRGTLRTVAQRAKSMSLRTGIPHEVDHVSPLSHRLVCGLTVAENLQVIPQRLNGRKGNAWSEEDAEQLVLFPLREVEQYEMRL